MAHSKLFVALALCLVVSTLLAPTQAVNRLFVDKISGYHQELVVAQDVEADLLRTTQMIVGAGVDVNSLDDHVIDTTGPVALNGSDLDITALNDIDITSFGGNVRFAGDSVGVSANGGGSISAVEATINANDLDLSYQTFEVDGARTVIRSLNDINVSGTDLNLSAVDAIEILASSVDITGDGDFEVVSDQSNVVVDAGKDVSFTATAAMTVIGQSGVDVISFHDDLSLSSPVGDATFTGENAEIRGLHTVSLNAGGDASFTAEILDTIAGTVLLSSGDDMVWTAEEHIDILSQGSAIVQAQDLIVSGASIGLQAGNDIILLSAGDTDFSAAGDIAFDGVNAVLAAGDDIGLDATAGLSFAGNVVDLSSDGNVLFNANPTGISLTAADHADITAADGALTVEANNLNVNFGETADFQAANDLLFRSNGDTSITGADSLSFNSRISSDFRATGTMDILSNGSVRVDSNQDVTLSADDSLLFQANTIASRGGERITVVAQDDLDFAALDNLLVQSNGGISISAEDSFSATGSRIGVLGRDVILGAGGNIFSVLADEIVLDSNVELRVRAGNRLDWSTSEDMQVSASDVDVASINGALSIESVEEDVTVEADNILVSSTDGNDLFSDSDISFEAETIFIYQEVELFASDLSVSAGDFVVSSVSDRDAVITVEGDPLETDVDGLSAFLGGSIFFGHSTVLSQAEEHTFTTNNGFDMTFDALDTVAFSAEIMTTTMPYIHYVAEAYGADIDSEAEYTAMDTLSISTVDFDVSVGDFIASQTNSVGSGSISGANGVDIDAVNGEFVLNSAAILQTADTDILYRAFQTTFNIDTNLGPVTINSDTSLYSSQGGTIDFSATGKQSFVGTTSSFDVNNNMVVGGDSLTYFSTGLTSFTAGNDFIANIVGDHSISGGSLDISGGTDVIFNVDSFVVKATEPSPGNPNESPVEVESEGDIALSGEVMDFYAFGNNPYLDEAITMIATGDVSYTAENANFVSFIGDNGINMTAASTRAISESNISFLAHMGGFLGDTFGAAISLLLEAFDHDPVTPSSATRVEASAASILLQGTTVDVVDGFFTIAGDSSVSFHNVDVEDISYESAAGGISAVVGSNFVVDSGNFVASTADGDLLASFNGGVLIHSTADQNPGQASDQIVFSGRADAPNGGTTILVGGDFHAYPSGDFDLVSGADAQVTSGTGTSGFLKIGSETGSFSLAADGAGVVSAGVNIELLAKGINGHVNYVAAGTYDATAESDFLVEAGRSSSFSSEDWTLNAATSIGFSSDAETEGIFVGNVNDNVDFISTLAPGTSDGIVVSGHYISLGATDTVSVDAAVLTVGENNQPRNPVVQVNLESLTATSVGTAQFTVANNDYLINGDLLAETSDGGNILLTSGGDQIYSTTFSTGVPGSSLLELSADAGDSVFIADDTIETETGDGSYDSVSIILQTQGSSTSSNFVATSNYNIEFDGDTIATVDNSARFVVGAVDINVGTDDVLINSSSGTLDVSSSHELIFSADDSIELATEANNAALTFSTQGPNSDLLISSLVVDFLALDGDVNVSGDRTRVFSEGNLELIAESDNNGKLQLEASHNVGISAGNNIDIAGGDSVYLDAVGEDSTVDVHTGESITVAANDIFIENNAGEGGSIVFTSAYEDSTIQFTTDSWDVDSDRDLVIESLGVFEATGAEYDVSALRSGRLLGDTVLLEATAGPVALSASSGSIRGRSEEISINVQDEVTFTAGNGVTFTSPEVDGTAVLNAGNFDFETDGSFTFAAEEEASISADFFLAVSAAGPIDIVSTHVSGDIIFVGDRFDLSAENIVFNATGSITGTSSAPSRNLGDQTRSSGDTGSFSISNQAPNADRIDLGFDIAYWNFYEDYSAPGYEFGQQDIIPQKVRKNVVSTIHESIPHGVSERDYWYNGVDLSSDSLNIFKGAQELGIHAETGDVRFHYAEDVLLAGTQISGVSFGGMVVRAYGQGRRSVAERDDTLVGTVLQNQAIQFAELSSLQFRTSINGDGSLAAQAKSGGVNMFTDSAAIFRSINEDLVFSAEGSLSLIHEDVSNGIDFSSATDLTVVAYDDDVQIFGEEIGFTVLGSSSLTMQTSAGSNGLNINTDEFTRSPFDLDSWKIVSPQGDIVFTSPCVGRCGAMSFTAVNIDIVSGNDVQIHYAENLNLSADRIEFTVEQTSTSDYSTADTGVVRFDGRSVTDHIGSDQDDVVKPTVFLTDELALQIDFGTSINSGSPQGMYCPYDRSFAPVSGSSAGFCVCLDHTWSCVAQSATIRYFIPNNPYAIP